MPFHPECRHIIGQGARQCRDPDQSVVQAWEPPVKGDAEQ